MDVKRFDIVLVDFPKLDNESIQCGIRPALVYSNDMCNTYSPVVTVIPFTSRIKKCLPTHLYFNEGYAKNIGLTVESTLLGECVMPVSKSHIICKMGFIRSGKVRSKVDEIIDIQLGRKKPDRISSVIKLDMPNKICDFPCTFPGRSEVQYV